MGEWSTGVLERLRGAFSGPEWESAVAAARQENEWFTPHQVARAVAALREEMLAPQQLGEWLSAYRKPAGWQPGRVGIVMGPCRSSVLPIWPPLWPSVTKPSSNLRRKIGH